MSVLARVFVDPPLDPSGEEARSLLERELAQPEYHQTNLLLQALAWLDRFVSSTIDTAARTPPLSAFAAILAFLVLVLALAWLLSRARSSARVPSRPGQVVADQRASAAQLRAAAERALAEGRHAEAVVEGFRALTVRQVERGGLEDRPGATAHEVAVALASTHPGQHQQVTRSAALFDAVRYGDRPATRDQAVDVLALDDALAGRR